MTASIVLIDYLDRKTLNNEQIEYLEKALIASIQKLKFTAVKPPVAKDKICDAALVAPGSYEIICIASILDILKPKQSQRDRKTKVFNILCDAGLIVSD